MLGDTIAAIASPPGVGARGVIRVSGPSALAAVGRLTGVALASARSSLLLAVPVRGVPIEALVLLMPAPGSYTGEDVVELHLPGSPLLLECVLGALRDLGVRAATPGEFTRRAFEHGRLRLEQAEAIADLIAADGDAARRLSLQSLAGGLGDGVAAVRAAVQDALAVLESGLDFADDETGAVAAEEWQQPAVRAVHMLDAVAAELPEVTPGGELLLLGAANAGKSSLANALLGQPALLVDAAAGTTRDVLAVKLAEGVTLLDAPGDLDAAAAGAVDAAALQLRDRLAVRAAGALLVIDLAAPRRPAPPPLPVVATLFTKADLVSLPGAAERDDFLAERGLGSTPRPRFFVSSKTGAGLPAVRAFLATAAPGSGPRHGLARWRAQLTRARELVQAARAAAAVGASDEIVAAELGQALAALDAIAGRSSPEAVLDRVFARFCLGK